MAESKLTAAQEQALEDDIAEFYADPLGYVMYAFPWGEKGTRLENHDGPDNWQKWMLAQLADGSLTPDEALQIAVASGHGIGKTAGSAMVILWVMSCRPFVRGRVTSNTGTQLNVNTWAELKLWQDLAINGHWFKWTNNGIYHVQHPDTWRIDAVTWTEHNSEAMAGLHGDTAFVLFDEASAIANVIWEVTDGALTTPGSIRIAMGNPTRNTGRFRDCFPGGMQAHRWRSINVDSRTARMTNKKYLESLVADHGLQSDYIRVRVLGQFPNAANDQLIDVATIEAAEKRGVAPESWVPVVMGVDCARYGDDASTIYARQGRRAWRLFKGAQLSAIELGDEVIRQLNGLRAMGHNVQLINIDVGNSGAGTIDYLKALGYDIVREVNFASASRRDDAYNLRASMYLDLRDWLKDGADLEAIPELKQDLISVNFYYMDKGKAGSDKIILERKKDAKKRLGRSPDDADGLACTFAYPVNLDSKDSGAGSLGMQQAVMQQQGQFAGLFGRR